MTSFANYSLVRNARAGELVSAYINGVTVSPSGISFFFDVLNTGGVPMVVGGRTNASVAAVDDTVAPAVEKYGDFLKFEFAIVIDAAITQTTFAPMTVSVVSTDGSDDATTGKLVGPLAACAVDAHRYSASSISATTASFKVLSGHSCDTPNVGAYSLFGGRVVTGIFYVVGAQLVGATAANTNTEKNTLGYQVVTGSADDTLANRTVQSQTFESGDIISTYVTVLIVVPKLCNGAYPNVTVLPANYKLVAGTATGGA